MSLMTLRKQSLEREIEANERFIEEKRKFLARVRSLEKKLGFS